MIIYELASGDHLVISDAGVRTIVLCKPYALSGGISVVQSLRSRADAIEAAGKATGPLRESGVCYPA